jgi:hypothetical protein
MVVAHPHLHRPRSLAPASTSHRAAVIIVAVEGREKGICVATTLIEPRRRPRGGRPSRDRGSPREEKVASSGSGESAPRGAAVEEAAQMRRRGRPRWRGGGGGDGGARDGGGRRR